MVSQPGRKQSQHPQQTRRHLGAERLRNFGHSSITMVMGDHRVIGADEELSQSRGDASCHAAPRALGSSDFEVVSESEVPRHSATVAV